MVPSDFLSRSALLRTRSVFWRESSEADMTASGFD
jgi:hypothetical protein